MTALTFIWKLFTEVDAILSSIIAPEQTLAFFIKKHLKQQGMAQKTLAYKVGTSQSRISEYIRGAVVPSLGIAARICKELTVVKEIIITAQSDASGLSEA